jgi:hypothetical protein
VYDGDGTSTDESLFELLEIGKMIVKWIKKYKYFHVKLKYLSF